MGLYITIGIIASLAAVGWLWWQFKNAPLGFEHPKYGFMHGRPEDYHWPADDPFAALYRIYAEDEGV